MRGCHRYPRDLLRKKAGAEEGGKIVHIANRYRERFLPLLASQGG